MEASITFGGDATMAMIYSVINNKGGTGKTTTVLNLGAALARRKRRVLLMDLDSQCNLTSALGLNDPEQGAVQCVGEALLGHAEVEGVLQRAGGMDVLPASRQLLDYERELDGEPGREFVLRERFADLMARYDYVLMDCPPSLSTLSVNSLVAANRYIVPMQAENFAYIGLDRILQVAEKVRARMNPALELAGVLFVKLNPRTKFSKAILSNLTQNPLVGDRIFDTYIRQDINLMESPVFRQSVLDYAPKSNGSEDFIALAKELVRQEKSAKSGGSSAQ